MDREVRDEGNELKRREKRPEIGIENAKEEDREEFLSCSAP